MAKEDVKPLSPFEIRVAAEILSRIQSPIPAAIFTEIARLVYTPLIELLPFRIVDGELYIRMIPRPEGDLVWPGMIHSPGSAFRPGEDIKPVLQRLFKGELVQGAISGDIRYVGIEFHNSNRGSELAFVCYHLEEPNAEIDGGRLYPVRDLPTNVVASQLPMIYRVADGVIAENNLEPLDANLPRAEIGSFEEQLLQLLASFSNG